VSKLASDSRPTERLEARVSKELKELFVHAARLSGVSLTSFIITHLTEAAKRTVQEHELMVLTKRDRETFVNALLNPPAPNRKLREAARRHRQLFGS